jgi:hypothetical protein
VEQFAEHIVGARGLLALVVRASAQPTKTTFVTEPEANLQVGFIVYPSGGTVARHMHRPPTRQVDSTSEALLIRSGRCLAEIYDEDGLLVRELDLGQGDVLVLFAGGHGFRMTEDTVMLEIKQGPYAGVEEKERF